MTLAFPQQKVSRLLEVIQLSLAVRRHFDLFHWLQSDIQPLLPHEILIAAWGDFSLELISYDVVSPLPGIRTTEFDKESIYPLLSALFTRWVECGHEPFTVSSSEGFEQAGFCPQISAEMSRMRCGLVHGIKDQRGRHDCLYVLLGPESRAGQDERQTLSLLLPYIDTAFRQIAHLPAQYLDKPADEAATEDEASKDKPLGISDREREIMNWVRQGKTNQEIGMILDISAFTVKNHLQRIYRKINVINRAQAVAKMEASGGDATH